MDFPDGTTKTKVHIRKHDTGKLFELQFSGNPPSNLAPGQKIKVQGKLARGKTAFAVAKDNNGRHKLTFTESAGSTAPVSGTKSLAVIVISSSDFTQTVTDAQLDSVFWSGTQNISGLYRTSSYGKMSFSKVGIYRTTLSYSTSQACNYNQYSSDAMRQIGSVNANYFLYIIPTNACGWAGLGNLCASGAWIPGGYALYGDVNAHELGHNVCMHHAAIDPDNNGTNDGEYNDTSCIMGYGGVGWRHFNAAHVDQEAWFPTGRRVDVTSSTTATIAPLEADPLSTGLPYALRLPRSGDFYYVSYRSAIDNYSSGLTNSGTVSIHHAGSTPGYSYLITNLSPGQSWTDSVNGGTISFASGNSTSATVQVSFGCVTNQPSITLQPVTQLTNTPGTSKDYLVTVINKNAVGCGVSHFILSGSLPSGFSGTFDSTTLDVAAGNSGATSLHVSSSIGETDGSFNFTVSASDSVGTASTSGQYVIDRTPPPGPSNVSVVFSRKGNKKGNTITFTNGVDDRSGLAGNNIYLNGVKINSSLVTSGSFRDAGGASGMTYGVTAIDRAGNESGKVFGTSR